uniref:Uncharacterized protein n=1 Tax=Homalodisca liturata TaxID=320908 RepID=A0A1B6IA30_9HEMI
MTTIYYFLMLTLLTDVFVSAFPVENDSLEVRLLVEKDDEEHNRLYARHDQERYDSDSEGLMDIYEYIVDEDLSGKPISDRRRRSLKATRKISTTSGEETNINKPDKGEITENASQDNVNDDETVTTTMPATKLKLLANEFCQEKISKFASNRVEDIQGPIYMVCNVYCCYLEANRRQ